MCVSWNTQERRDKRSGIEGKSIAIETTRHHPSEFGLFPAQEFVDVRGIISSIRFSHPVRDFKGREKKELFLKTAWFSRGLPNGFYWKTWVNDENNYALGNEEIYGKLDEDFSSYSEQRLQEWQNQGIRHHDRVLRKIEDLYWQGREIPRRLVV